MPESQPSDVESFDDMAAWYHLERIEQELVKMGVSLAALETGRSGA